VKILVLHTWGLGDLILATPMLKSLYKSGHQVELALFSSANQVILQQNTFLENIHLVSSKWELLKFFGRFDALVATAGTDPKKVKMLAKILGIRQVFAAPQERDVHRIRMNLKIVQPLLHVIDQEPYIYSPSNPALIAKYKKNREKLIGFAVGSGKKQKFKRWQGFKDLIKRMPGKKLVFIGPDEEELYKEYEKLDVTIVKEPLENILALTSHLDLLVGNDNGLMHIGYATRINTVTIYGMTNEKETGGYRQNNKAIFLEMKCRPCFDPSTDKIGCTTLDCLRDLSVERVWSVCQEFL